MTIRKPTLPAYCVLNCATLVVLIFWSAAAWANTQFFVARPPAGNDANDCLGPSTACRTFQHAVDLCPKRDNCSIVAAPGKYSRGANVYHYKFITIAGPWDSNGKCIDRSAIVVDDTKNDPSNGGNIFWVQDHATLILSCMTLRSEHSNGFSTRQFAIGDVNDINFSLSPGTKGVAATESSKITINSPSVDGSAQTFAYASDLSQITLVGHVELATSVAFQIAFLSSIDYSIINFYPSESADSEDFDSASYQCIEAMIKTNSMLPGGNKPWLGSEDCELAGIANVPPGVARISSAQLGALSQQSENFLHESAEQLNDVSRETTKQRHLDHLRFSVFAVSVSVISLLAAVAAFFSLWRLRRFSRG